MMILSIFKRFSRSSKYSASLALCGVVFSFSWHHGVSAATLEDLVHSSERPTMSQVADAMNWDFSKNPFAATVNSTDSHLLRLIETSGPELIAQLEYSYPGAVWAPLGRDAVIAGDFLEAFYLVNQQMDRVIRINASTGSFRSNIPLIDLFKSLGLVGTEGKDELPTKRFVILDRTSYGWDSQSTKLISTVFEKIPPSQRNHYLSEVGVIALGNNNHTSITPNLNLPEFRRSLGESGPPSRILSTAIALSDSTAWHNTFGPFYKQSDGKVATTLGSISDEFTRRKILTTMVEIFRIVKADAFEKSLKTQLQKYGANILDPFLFEQALATATNETQINATIEQLGFITQEHIEALEKHYIRIGIYSKNLSILSKVCSNLSEKSKVGFITILLKGFSNVNDSLKILQACAIHSFQRERLISDNIRVILNQRPSLDQILSLDNLLDHNGPISQKLNTQALSRAVSSENPSSQLKRIFTHLRLEPLAQNRIQILQTFKDPIISLLKIGKLNCLLGDDIDLLKQFHLMLPQESRNEFLATLFNPHISLDFHCRLNLFESLSGALKKPIGLELSQLFQNFLTEVRGQSNHPSLSRDTLVRIYLADPSILDFAFDLANSAQELSGIFKTIGSFNREQSKIAEKHVRKMIQYHSYHQLMLTALKQMPSESRSDFIVLLLNSVSNLDEGFKYLHLTKFNTSLLLNYLPTFFSFQPSVAQINQLIQWVPRNSELHFEMMLHALKTLQTREDYEALKRPSMRRSVRPDYVTAKRAFKMSHPKKGWGYFLERFMKRSGTSIHQEAQK